MTKSNDDALQTEISNGSSLHVERIIVHDPSIFLLTCGFLKMINW